MTYKLQDFSYLLDIAGLSEPLLKNHFSLYEGYVNNVNQLLETLKRYISEEKIRSIEFAELKRRFGWEFNGMRLHEYYFEGLSKQPKIMDKESRFFKKLIKDFGSYKSWEEEFKAMGSMRGIGWVVLYLDTKTGKLINVWINEHDTGHLSGGIPLIVLDVFEHAYMLDYGIKKADYLESIFNCFNWAIINSRFIEALK